MKKLFLIIPLIIITVFCFGCNGETTPAVTETEPNQPVEGSATETVPKESEIEIPSPPESSGSPAEVSEPEKSVMVLAESGTVAVGDTFEVVVAVNILDEVSRGAECELYWSPAVLLECTEVADGDFFEGFDTVHIGASGEAAISNDAGMIKNMGQFCTNTPDDGGASGEGILFIYYFTAKDKGEVTISVSDESLLIGDVTGDAEIILDTIEPAVVTIQ